MTFLHNNTTFEIQKLTYTNNKWSYTSIWNFKWKIKPFYIDRDDENLALEKWEIYKLTYYWFLDLQGGEKVKINDGVFAGEYTVKTHRFYKWIWFWTTKMLLIKN